MQLDMGAVGDHLTALRPTPGLVAQTREFDTVVSQQSANVRCGQGQALSRAEGMPPEELQNVLWRDFFSDRNRTEWWDNRRTKRSPRHPDFKHKKSRAGLWLDNRHKPAWVDLMLAEWDAGRTRPPESFQGPGASITSEGHSKVEMCSELCIDGQIPDVVDALSLLVQQGCHMHNNIFYRVLKRCIAERDLVQGRRVHALTVKSGYEGHPFLATHLISMYASHGRLEEAMQVFTRIHKADVYNWATIILAHARHGEAAQAIRLYRQLRETSIKPDNRIYTAVLKACATAGDLIAGKEVHAQLLASPEKPDSFVETGLIDMYAKCGILEDARRVFDRLPERNVVTWNAMIAGYAQHGMGEEALSLYSSVQKGGLSFADSVTFVCLLQACASVGAGALHHGKRLHLQIIERQLQDNLVLGGSLVNMYAKCGSTKNARQVFDRLDEKNVVTWSALIAGYVQEGMAQEALTLYKSMQQQLLTPPNSVTYTSLLQACANVGAGALPQGRELHAQIEERGLGKDVVVGGSLVNMYAKCGSLEDARRVFDGLPERNVVTWTAMIAGYTQQGMGQEALNVYSSAQEGLIPLDSIIYACLLQACASVGVGALHQAKRLHAHIAELGLQDDVVVGGSLVNMYAKCGLLEEARGVFDKLSEKNVITWTAMIAGYTQEGMGDQAIDLFTSMQRDGIVLSDSVTFVCLLQACTIVGVEALHHGKQIHARLVEQDLENDVVVGGSLVNMYVKCGSLDDARNVFDRLPDKNVVTWTAMIAGYGQLGMGEEAIRLYIRMEQEGITPPDSITFVCLLQACADVAALPLGKQLHAQIEEGGLQADPFVGAALVNLYAKCGSMFDSQQVFDSLPERTVEAWGALIGGYARQGDSEMVFGFLSRMSLEDVQPCSITLLSVLTVCSHAGLVDKGRLYFECMRTDFGISPTVEHYTCMMDLLGRAGHLDEALQMARTMPLPPDVAVWLTLLGACHKWNDVQVGQQAFEFAVRCDEKNAAPYVLMANIYAKAGMWEEAKEMQARRVKYGAWKQPGQSWWTDSDGMVHTFAVGDKKHPESEGIYSRLDQLLVRMKKEGYVPHLPSSLKDVPDDEKESELCGHSEKLAIAYALNKTPEGSTIRVVKNLRVCVDCHQAISYVSRVENRIIICRDASRFHVFKDGTCSCGNYW